MFSIHKFLEMIILNDNKKPYILVALIFISCCFLALGPAKEKTLAEGEETLSCNKEIPIGEMVEEAVGMMGDVKQKQVSFEGSLAKEIELSEKMISLAQGCNPDKCKPSCKTVTHSEPDGKGGAKTFTECIKNACTGNICPGKDEMKTVYADIEKAYNELINLQKESKALVEDKTHSWDYEEGSTYQNSTQIEILKNKLQKSRETFQDCYSTPQEIEMAAEGKTTVQSLMDCESGNPFVEKPRKECENDCKIDKNSEACEKCLQCKSQGNYYCCQAK